MNFALSILVVILLLLPGSTVIVAYYKSFKEKQAGRKITFTDLLLKGLFFSFLFHTIALCFLSLQKKEVFFNVLYPVFSGASLPVSNQVLLHHVQWFALYILVLVFTAFVLTKFVKRLIVRFNLDINFHALRINNYWYQVFSSRYLEVRNVQGTKDQTDIIYLEVLVKTNVIYSGILTDFNYNPQKDELENIVLINAEVSKPAKTAQGHSIEGVLIIPNTEIKNISINYVSVRHTDATNDESKAGVTEQIV